MNYSVMEKEMLSIVHRLKFCSMLYGTQLTILTDDHKTRKFLASALPEYDVVRINFKLYWQKSRVQWELPDVGRNNPWDILIRSLTGGCSTASMEHWIKDGFRGNEVLVSGENHGDYMPQNMERKFVIGPLHEVDPKTNKTNDHVLTLTYMQMVWYTFFRPAYKVQSQKNIN